MTSNKVKTVRSQFGANAQAYAESHLHARGPSLAHLLEQVGPQPDWQVLDVATGAGHTANTIAPLVARVVATDITKEMLDLTIQEARRRNLGNVLASYADGQELPFKDNVFDLVTCRLATHHFPNIDFFMNECWRVLKSSCQLAVVDNIVPGSHRSGKEADLQRKAGRYVNAFEKLRDPSHVKCLSVAEWEEQFYQGGFRLKHQGIIPRDHDFDQWAARMQVPTGDTIRLRAMLKQAPPAVAEFLAPSYVSGRVDSFRLHLAVLVGEKIP